MINEDIVIPLKFSRFITEALIMSYTCKATLACYIKFIINFAYFDNLPAVIDRDMLVFPIMRDSGLKHQKFNVVDS